VEGAGDSRFFSQRRNLATFGSTIGANRNVDRLESQPDVTFGSSVGTAIRDCHSRTFVAARSACGTDASNTAANPQNFATCKFRNHSSAVEVDFVAIHFSATNSSP
jgi:hypothetical protein